MLDIKFIRENPEKVKKACKDKGVEEKVVDELLVVDERRREHIRLVEEKQQELNKATEQVKKEKDDKKRLLIIANAKKIKTELKNLEPELKKDKKIYKKLLLQIPNIPHPDVPVGDKPKVVRKWGKIPEFDFEPKDHIQLAEKLDLIDFKRGSKVAGFRGYFLKNEAVLLHFGLMDWVLKKLIKKGFIPFVPPVVDKKEAFYHTGHFPWGEKEAYKLKDDQYLAGTSEVPMVAYHSQETLNEKDLPLKYVAFSPCFRREIGSYGKDTRGIYRLHEFLKIEQIIICKNDFKKSEKWLEELAKISEEILQELNIAYQVCLMPTGDMGEPQMKKYDIEAWMPGRKEYGELMSDSMMGEFQARRAGIKYSTKGGKKYVHTLNNTAIAFIF